MGTGHTNDFVITTPASTMAGSSPCSLHEPSDGYRGIGFGPDATDVFMEGLYIPFRKLFVEGRPNETPGPMIRANTRLPIDTIGDVYSLTACNDVGCRRLVEMMGEFELDDLDLLATHILEKSRAAVMAEIARLPKGSWSNTMVTGRLRRADHAVGHDDHSIKASMSTTRARVPGQGAGSTCRSLIRRLYGVRPRLCRCVEVPNNAGSLERLTVSAPEDSIVNALKPAPVLIAM